MGKYVLCKVFIYRCIMKEREGALYSVFWYLSFVRIVFLFMLKILLNYSSCSFSFSPSFLLFSRHIFFYFMILLCLVFKLTYFYSCLHSKLITFVYFNKCLHSKLIVCLDIFCLQSLSLFYCYWFSFVCYISIPGTFRSFYLITFIFLYYLSHVTDLTQFQYSNVFNFPHS